MAKNAYALAADMIKPPSDDWVPLPHQVPPPGWWFAWLLCGGRGMGKTATGARHFHEHIMGPPCLPGVPGGHWPGILAPTLGDAVTSCVNGPSGLRKWCPDVKVRVTPGGTVAKYPNGVEAKLFGAHTEDDVDRLRSGGNRCIFWVEEWAAARFMDEAMQHIRYGLRVGPWPHMVITTTPRNRKMLKDFIADAKNEVLDSVRHQRKVVMSTATTADNPHLDASVKQALYDDYGGTRLGLQELLGQILEDVQGALWSQSLIDNERISAEMAPHSYDRVVVGVDPHVKDAKNVEDAAECGILVAGKKTNWNYNGMIQERPHAFILDDYSLGGGNLAWARAVVRAYHDYNADMVVAEANNGGDLVKVNIHTVDPNIPVKIVHASRGKAKRAEPIVNAYEQGRVHHVGSFPKAEEQMTTWDATDPDPSWSPDRMDGLVWAVWDLIAGKPAMSSTGRRRDTRHRGRR